MTANPRQEKLYARMEAVWRREQMLHLSAGAMATLRWAVPLFLVGVAVDWTLDLPALARVIILALVVSVPLFKAWGAGWRYVRAFDARHVALRTEKSVEGLESLLVSAVQFGRTECAAGASGALVELTLRRAEEAVAHVRPEQAVAYHGLKRPAQWALAVCLFMGGVALINGPVLAAGAARIFAPWLSIRYPTRTQIAMESGDLVVKEGDPARIVANLSGVVPAQAQVALRTGSGNPREHSLTVKQATCEYTIESAFRSFEYRVRAGDAVSDWHSVLVVPSPRIVRAEVRLVYPPYTGRPEESVEALTMHVPEGTRIEWKLTLDRAVKQADFSFSGEGPQVIAPTQDGRAVSVQHVATQSRAYRFVWMEAEHGFSFTSPSYYLQVEPDQAPSVELSTPNRDLYAMLGRKIDLSYRGRDDHGIGEVKVAYRVDKTEEQTVRLTPPSNEASGAQRLDWDYRTVLPDLAVGSSVTFVIEVADRYPGPNGPHRVRSMSRRVSFLSREDYLARVAQQKQRLLKQLRGIYREQREVHAVIRDLNPADSVFVQSCQLEAVRQDLLRERLLALKGRMDELIEDLAANNITEEKESALLVALGSDLKRIADDHVARAAASLRALATDSNQATANRDLDIAPAVQMVDSGARELACLMMKLEFRDAAEAMARELHAAAESQAFLRMRTLSASADPRGGKVLPEAQEELAQWLTRLFAATPWYKESTPEDAIIAFVLSRIVRKLGSDGADTGMREAAELIRKDAREDAAHLQAQLIAKLLDAEFRLRVGAEHEALGTVRDGLTAQAKEQKRLREESSALLPEQFEQRRSEIARAQMKLHSNLQVLLLPVVPASRARLLDEDLPKQPPTDVLMAAIDTAMRQAAAHIAQGNREEGAKQQAQAEKSLEELVSILDARIEELTGPERARAAIGLYAEGVTKLGLFKERQLALLEKTEDAAADHSDTAHLAELERNLADEIVKLRDQIQTTGLDLGIPGRQVASLRQLLDRADRSLREAIPYLETNKPDQAKARQEAALDLLETCSGAIDEQNAGETAFLATLDSMLSAQRPGPYVGDIEDEQHVLLRATKDAKPDQLPRLAVGQKNLIHAVNAVLNALDVLSDKIDSGTVMQFAKEDMNAAGTALQTNDLVEAADAQDAVAESLADLKAKLDALAPQFAYIFEVAEYLNGAMPDAAMILDEQRQLQMKSKALQNGASLDGLLGEQRALLEKAKAWHGSLQNVTGLPLFDTVVERMGEAVAKLEAGDRPVAVSQMETVVKAFSADRSTSAKDPPASDRGKLLVLMSHLAVTLVSPSGFAATSEPSPEMKLLLDVLALATKQKALYRQTQAAPQAEIPKLVAKHSEIATACEALAARSNGHPNLVAAHKHLAGVVACLSASDRDGAIAGEREAVKALRHFVVEYVLNYVQLPGSSSSDVPVDSYEEGTEMFKIFMPGAVSGVKPKSGRQEWEVLGRRERAALNENFARELPLEYRAILKDYYERLAQ